MEAPMPRDLSEAVDILKEHGLDFVKLILDTHAETMLRLGSLLGDFLEIALKTQIVKSGKAVNENSFQSGGNLHALADKIKRAKTVGLLDEAARKDADTLRKMRNEFAHLKTKIHFDSPVIEALAAQLSTYEPGKPNQKAIEAAMDKVTDHLKDTLKTL
jgi:mannitol operon repressor